MIVLKIDSISKHFDDKKIIEKFSLNIEKSKTYVIKGRSGSGKSTILQMIGLLSKPTSGGLYLHKDILAGKISFDPKVDFVDYTNLSDKNSSIIRNKVFGFVYQFHYLMSDFTVLENIMLPSALSGNNSTKKAEYILDRLNILDKKDSMPYMLSGGEKQRVAIARAVINDPAVLIADEPTGNLDGKNESDVLEFIYEIVKKNGMSVVFASHSSNLISTVDEVIEI
jgi:lipoprotein-releasing system ATP-binding protein